MKDVLCSLMLVKLKSRTRLVLKDTWKSAREVRGKAVGGEKVACALACGHRQSGEATRAVGQ